MYIMCSHALRCRCRTHCCHALGPVSPPNCPQLATVIYVDSPAGAGLSYSMRPESDYHTNDERTTQDLVVFLEVGRPTGLTST